MKSPITLKTYMAAALLILIIAGIIKIGISKTLPQLLIALAVCVALDLAVNYFKKKKFILPDSSVITAFFIAAALSIGQRWYIPIIAAAMAVLSKHIIKIKNRHIFNPAVFGLLAVMLLFNSPIEWWASSPLWLVIIFGIFLMYKMKNYYLISSYFLTSVIISLLYHSIKKTEITFGILFFSINFFFMMFMLVEPMTSPFRKKGKIIYGILAALFSFAATIIIPQYDNSIIALITADLFVPLLNKL